MLERNDLILSHFTLPAPEDAERRAAAAATAGFAGTGLLRERPTAKPQSTRLAQNFDAGDPVIPET
ncbi:MAG: hypothetical protein EA417_06765 [Gammaproteobacteria bacterium]|nr:MAG: hypothetical protein EA417_06765 [Gammaproteobacteria bacterium]